MIRTNEEAVAAALATSTNVPDTCQKVTRGYYLAASAGDRDGDGDADAYDGWLSEPASARHPGDRHPRLGSIVSWSGGSAGHGHRAIVVQEATSTTEALIRSTDAPTRGVTSTVPLSWPERTWGLRYLGSSDTIDGEPITFVEHAAAKPAPKPAPKPTALDQIRGALTGLIGKARPGSQRKKALRRSRRDLPGGRR